MCAVSLSSLLSRLTDVDEVEVCLDRGAAGAVPAAWTDTAGEAVSRIREEQVVRHDIAACFHVPVFAIDWDVLLGCKADIDQVES